MSRNLVNALLFQVVWFACVLGGAADSSLWGGAALALLLAHSLGPALADHPGSWSPWWESAALRSDLLLMSAALVVGFVLDTLWIHLQVLDYAGVSVAPAWIVMLWLAVGASINHGLSMFRARPWLGGLLAGACAPLSYLAGERLGAVTVVSLPGLAGVAVVWAALFVVAFTVAANNHHDVHLREIR